MALSSAPHEYPASTYGPDNFLPLSNNRSLAALPLQKMGWRKRELFRLGQLRHLLIPSPARGEGEAGCITCDGQCRMGTGPRRRPCLSCLQRNNRLVAPTRGRRATNFAFSHIEHRQRDCSRYHSSLSTLGTPLCWAYAGPLIELQH